MAKAVKSYAGPVQKIRGAGRDRLSCRIDPRIKQRAEQAAALLGQDLTTFTQSALDEKARAVIEHNERLVMSEADFEKFVASISNPKPVGEKLRAAAEQYKAISQQNPEANW